jgi:hypothetical protein
MQHLKRLEESSQTYIYREYPKWKYHPQKEAVIVQNYIEEKALGTDWYNTPTEVAKAMEQLAEQVRKLKLDAEKEEP